MRLYSSEFLNLKSVVTQHSVLQVYKLRLKIQYTSLQPSSPISIPLFQLFKKKFVNFKTKCINLFQENQTYFISLGKILNKLDLFVYKIRRLSSAISLIFFQILIFYNSETFSFFHFVLFYFILKIPVWCHGTNTILDL